MALGLSTVYFWQQGGQAPENTGDGARKAVQQVVVKEVPPVRVSPAVTSLGQDQDEINEQKAAEMKHAIVENTYSNGENTQQGAAEHAGAGGVIQTLSSQTQEEALVLPQKIILPLAANSLSLTTEANKEYKEFVEQLKAHPKAKLLVKGFVSASTDSPENIKLSEERAIVVQKMLVASGIESTRMQIKGMGNREPIASNNTSDGRTKNRRVEIIVVENN